RRGSSEPSPGRTVSRDALATSAAGVSRGRPVCHAGGSVAGPEGVAGVVRQEPAAGDGERHRVGAGGAPAGALRALPARTRRASHAHLYHDFFFAEQAGGLQIADAGDSERPEGRAAVAARAVAAATTL